MAESVRKGFFIILIFIGLALVSSPARAQIGFAGGYGIHLTSSPSFSSAASNEFTSSGGYNIGLFYDFRFGRVTLRPGVFLRKSTFEWEMPAMPNASFFNPIEDNIRIAEIPIDVLFHFRTGSISPYVVVGPVFHFLTTNSQDLRISLDQEKGTTTFPGVTLGAGLELSAGGIVLFPEVRFSYALSGFLKEDYIVRTIPYTADSSQKISTLTLRLAISLPSPEY